MKTLRTFLAALGLMAAFAVSSQAAIVFDLTFDELGSPTPVTVPGLFIPAVGSPGQGTTVSYFGGTGATYGYGSFPSIYPGIDTPFLEGDADGTVRFDFSTPVASVIFNIGLESFFNLPVDYTVTVFEEGVVGPALSFDRDISSPGLLPYETFSLFLPNQVITAIQVSFAAPVNRFAIDNLLADPTVVPEASSMVLAGLGTLGAGVIGYRRRRRVA